jgi:hypothetical protein
MANFFNIEDVRFRLFTLLLSKGFAENAVLHYAVGLGCRLVVETVQAMPPIKQCKSVFLQGTL